MNPYVHPIRLAVWVFLVWLAVPLLSPAQNASTMPIPPDAEYPFKRDMAKGKYDKADEKIKRRIERDSNNLECHYAAYWLYSTAAFERHNLDIAYRHLVRVRTLFANANEKELERWARDSYSGARIDYDLYRLGCLALDEAHKVRTPDAYQRVLNHYPLLPAPLRDSATNSRDSLEFDIARRAGDIQTVQDFIDRRPHSAVNKDAVIFRDSLAFAEADSRHSYTAYQHFRVSYPHSHLYGRATDSVYVIEYRDAVEHNSEQYYRGYAERYPSSPYTEGCVWRADSIEYHRETDTSDWQSLIHYLDTRNRAHWSDTAADHLARFALRHQHVTAATQALRRLKASDPHYNRLGLWLHDAYLHTSVTNFSRFYKSRAGRIIPQEQRAKDSLALILYQHYDYRNIDSCIRTIAPYHEAFIMLQQLIKDDVDHQRWSNAVNIITKYGGHFGNDYDYLQLLATLETKAEASVRTQPLVGANTAKGDEYAPVISADERTLYFAARNREENIGGEDIYVIQRKGNKWGTATLEMDLSHTYGNEAPVSVSVDGNSLLLYQSGILYQADKAEEGWNVNRLPATINSSSWQSDATFAANGRALLFAAKGKTDHEVDSSLNLYVSLLDDQGRWGTPIELGPMVNTPFDERSPCLHPDMRTLYFSSEGHGAMGQMDVYMTTRLDDSWTHWSAPINLGKEVNTSGDDWGYKVNTSGDKAYFARHANGSQNIFTTTLPHRARPQAVALVTGTVKKYDGSPLATCLRWESPYSGQTLGQCYTNPANGQYSILLPYGQVYGVYVCDSNYFPSACIIDLQAGAPEPNKTYNLQTASYRQMVEDSLGIQLNNTTFDISNPKPNASSYAELSRIARIITSHHFKAVIECHVDGTPGDKDNLELSKRRAAAIRDLLIARGCRPSDIIDIGLGSDYPMPYDKGTRTRPQQRRILIRLY